MFENTVHNGGDEAVAAVERIGKDWREQLEQAADEIARLRLAVCRLADQDATLSVCSGNVTVTLDATLTDAEREALEFVVAEGRVACGHEAEILRALLARLA